MRLHSKGNVLQNTSVLVSLTNGSHKNSIGRKQMAKYIDPVNAQAFEESDGFFTDIKQSELLMVVIIEIINLLNIIIFI